MFKSGILLRVDTIRASQKFCLIQAFVCINDYMQPFIALNELQKILMAIYSPQKKPLLSHLNFFFPVPIWVL